MKTIDQNHIAFKTYTKIYEGFNTELGSLDWDKIETFTDHIEKIVSELEAETGRNHFSEVRKERKNGKKYIARIQDRFGEIKAYAMVLL